MRRALLTALVLVLGTGTAAAQAPLVILTPTGEIRDGLPVLRPHEHAAAIADVLARGFSGRLLRLYTLEQEFLRRKTGRAPEPAYLALTNRQGGFPQFGFYLDRTRKPEAGWVDLQRGSRASGQFGALDQIFPHELMHIIVRQLAGEPRKSGGNQVHAIGVRSDPVTAFNEGFAEHVQILAVDDPDAANETRALAVDADVRRRADRATREYAHDLAAGWWPLEPSRLRFLLWFSAAEQVQRYDAVKANLFARTPAIPERLLAREDKYPAYLYSSVVPGTLTDAVKPAGVMLSTDGAVSHLFWRLVTDPALQQRYHDDAFYDGFGTARAAVPPLENVYLKIFAVLYEARPSTAAELLRAWARRFPEDAVDIERVTRAALLGQSVPDAREIWLANDAFTTGTSLFDQYRALPRSHTFDANAASELDWLAVPGVTHATAARLMADAPYRNLDALLTSASLPAAVRARLSDMAAAMTRLQTRAADQEESLDLWAIARSYLWRLGAVILVATLAGTWIARRTGVRRIWTAALVALAACFIVVAFAWIVTCPPWYPFAAPVVLGGLPWALWRLVRRGLGRPAAQPLLIWAAAALPALVLTFSW